MNVRGIVSQTLNAIRVTGLSLAVLQMSVGPVLAATAEPDLPSPGTLGHTASPIKHVIVIIGENRSFDHVFATYQPKDVQGHPQHVHNLLSEGIVALDANNNAVPGWNFDKAQQNQASDRAPDSFLLSPPQQRPFGVLPNPLAGGPRGAQANLTGFCGFPGAPFPSCAILAEAIETGLPDASYYASLASGGTGLPSGTPDTRIQWAGRSVENNDLLPGPFQLTSASLQYTDYAASPVHRFYQMWQQLDCSIFHASWENPAGCDAKLFSWVETTVGAGTNGTAQPANFATNYLTDQSARDHRRRLHRAGLL